MLYDRFHIGIIHKIMPLQIKDRDEDIQLVQKISQSHFPVQNQVYTVALPPAGILLVHTEPLIFHLISKWLKHLVKEVLITSHRQQVKFRCGQLRS